MTMTAGRSYKTPLELEAERVAKIRQLKRVSGRLTAPRTTAHRTLVT